MMMMMMMMVRVSQQLFFDNIVFVCCYGIFSHHRKCHKIIMTQKVITACLQVGHQHTGTLYRYEYSLRCAGADGMTDIGRVRTV